MFLLYIQLFILVFHKKVWITVDQMIDVDEWLIE